MAYDISFYMLVLFVASAFAVGIFGTVRKIPLFAVVAGICILSMFVAVDAVVLPDVPITNSTDTIVKNTFDYMNQPTSNALLTLRNAQPIFAGQEVGNDNSLLNMREINQLTFRIDRTGGNVPGKLYAGVWETQSIPSLSTSKFIIGEIMANGTSGSEATYTLTRNDTKTYFLKVNEAVGILFDNGDAGNNMAVAVNTTASSFDGANTYRTVFSEATNSWTDTVGHDFRFTVSLVKTDLSTTNELINDGKEDIGFTTNKGAQIKLFFLIFGISFMFIGAIEQKYGI